MSQTTLPVRTDDPVTSCEAALKAVLGASRVRPVVLEALSESGPLTHDEFIAAYHARIVMTPDTPRASESGIRTRLKEPVNAGLATEGSQKGVSRFGDTAERRVAVEADDAAFACLEDADEGEL
ncbi:hypothetical protein [Streptomyces halobius]|uniref:Uncharacterized protein n=1 Tax=Streptomyces halobius TaxID=2879846 RepID=A0ABY4M0I7_9ACTN|nr:hypothetical protein [Streptomyces halobius]UQA91266.1 hypothetical protein K9S39_04675 [Streptomyces halobius]